MHWKQSTPNIFHEAAQGAEKKKIGDEKKRLNCAHSKRYSKWKTKNPQTSAYFCSSVFIDCDKNHFAMDYCLTSISYYESELMRFTKELKSNHQFRCEKEELRVKKSYQVSLLRSIISISFSQIHTHTHSFIDRMRTITVELKRWVKIWTKMKLNAQTLLFRL